MSARRQARQPVASSVLASPAKAATLGAMLPNIDVLLVLSTLPAAAWAVLAFGRQGFWYRAPNLDDADPPLETAPEVVAVVPARNEAPFVECALRSVLGQRYPGRLSVVLVDDHSDDGTGAIAERLAAADDRRRLHVVPAGPLPLGWTGKLWAVDEGLRAAAALAPDARHVLLTDADIAHDPDALRRLVALSEARTLDLASVMVRLRCDAFWERVLIPPFVFFFQMLYPFPAVNHPEHPMAAAAGGCMLVRRDALEEAGGIAAIRDRLIDDVALAAAIKHRPGGGRIWLGLTRTTVSLRSYAEIGEIWRTVARTADTQLGHSLWRLAGTVVVMTLVFAGPPVLLAAALLSGSSATAALAGASLIAMGITFAPTARLYGRSPVRGVALPLVALLYLAMTLDSAARYRRGRGGQWKGRIGAPRRERDPIDTMP